MSVIFRVMSLGSKPRLLEAWTLQAGWVKGGLLVVVGLDGGFAGGGLDDGYGVLVMVGRCKVQRVHPLGGARCKRS